MSDQPEQASHSRADLNAPDASLSCLPVVGGLLLFLLFLGIIDWAWQSKINPQVTAILHAVLALGAVVFVMTVLGWLVHLASRPIAVRAAVTEDEKADMPLVDPQSRLDGYTRWFIHMRWIAILVASLLLVVALRVLHLLPAATEAPLWFTVGLLVLCNLAYLGILRSGKSNELFLQVQVYLDLLLLAVLLHYSGGIENPLLFLTLFHVIIAGILLSRRQCYAVAITASLLIEIVAWSEWAAIVPHYKLYLFPHVHDMAGAAIYSANFDWYVGSAVTFLTVTLLLVAHFVTTLAERARADERFATAMARRAVAERQLLEQALSTTGAGLCVIDDKRRYAFISKRWKEWFLNHGSKPSGVESVPSSTWQGSPAESVLRDGVVRVSERTLHRETDVPQVSERELRVFQVTTAPLKDSQGRAQAVELAQDVTLQKRVQAQLRQAEKMAAVGGLAGNVVHEVNNPIGIISAKGRLLLADHREEMSKKVAEEITKITDAADRVAATCRGLLTFCRPSMGQRTPLDVRVPVKRAVALIEHRAQEGKVTVVERVPEGLPPIIANPNEIQQVILNLLINALDATPENGKLTVSAFEESGLPENQRNVTVVVEDTGHGMSKDILGRIFDPFFTTKDEGEGTGLGLSICLGIVQAHGGAIDVDSEPGRGTRIAVRLPCAGGSAKNSTEFGRS